MGLRNLITERRTGERRSGASLPIATAVILVAMYFCTASIIKRLELLEIEAKEGRSTAEKYIVESRNSEKNLLDRMTGLEVQQRVLQDKQQDYSASIEVLKQLVRKKYSKDSN